MCACLVPCEQFRLAIQRRVQKNIGGEGFDLVVVRGRGDEPDGGFDLLADADGERTRGGAVECRGEFIGDDGAGFTEHGCRLERKCNGKACALAFGECAGWSDELVGICQAAD